jgi:hypothetical protein
MHVHGDLVHDMMFELVMQLMAQGTASQAFARHAGLCNALMCYNSQLRQLYDAYVANKTCWFHAGAYAAQLGARPSYGLLSFQVWLMLLDSSLADEELPLSLVCQAIVQACMPGVTVVQRRSRVLKTAGAAGVWTFDLPKLSPFRVRGNDLAR